jgi:hypothetical protein
MDLTSIIYNFTTSKVESYFDGIFYKIPVVTNLATVQAELDSEAGFTVARAVVQYKDNLTVPRVVMTDGNDDPDSEQKITPSIASLSANLTSALATARGEVETEITNQTV